MKQVWRLTVAMVGAALIGACALELTNTEAAREVARAAEPPGSVYIGWRVFQDRCARCHGSDATGGTGPNLLQRVPALGPRRFVDLVLRRYEWNLPAAQAGSEGAARDALIDALMRREAGAQAMPAWEGEPRVQAHIVDLHAYLVARSDGRQGPGRPAGP
jgi:mono/diheme cytochrome c family protein